MSGLGETNMTFRVWISSTLVISLALIISMVVGNAQLNGLDKPETTFPVIELEKDLRWTFFSFGLSMNFVNTRFEFSTQETLCLELTDLHCSGDQFVIFDKRRRLINTSAPQKASCAHKGLQATIPDVALESETYSSVRHLLPKGTHNITIYTTQSPYGGGQAAIRLIDQQECYK